MTTITASATNPQLGRLVLVDIENMAGCSPRELTTDQIANLVRATRRAVGRFAGDVVLVACNPAWLFAVRRSWPEAIHRAAGGPDGADIALCQAATPAVLRRFSSLCVVSGDGRLACPARRARSLGLRVTVISRRRSLSRGLRDVAHRVLRFDWHATAPEREHGNLGWSAA
jgi:hypothetical protein